MPETPIVVIGSNSFSGASFVAHARTQGASVIGISRSSEPDPVFLPYKQNQSGAFEFHKLDLNGDLSAIVDLIRAKRCEYVVNFAAQSMVAESWAHPEHWFQTNAVATVRLHDELRKCDFLKKYVHISTPEVYGTCQGLVPENTNYNPSTPYAVSRAAADMSLMTFFKTYKFPAIFTRAANVYGPSQQLYRIIPRTILFFLTGRKLQLHGGGHSVRSFIHIRDVADATWKAMMSGPAGEMYHISTTRTISIRALVEMIAERLGVSFEKNVEIVDDRPGKDTAYLLDSAKARTQLGWSDRISLEDGVDETIRWVKENLNTLKTLPWDYIHKA